MSGLPLERKNQVRRSLDPAHSVPAVLERAGAKVLFAANEFFAARISNPHTRRAYARVVRRFLAWCEEEHFELPGVSPGLAGRFIDQLPGDSSTKNQALAGHANPRTTQIYDRRGVTRNGLLEAVPWKNRSRYMQPGCRLGF